VHKVYFVSGKGGVGKSTIAAFLARKEALSGKKTLLVEMGPWSYYQKWWGGEARYTPQKTPFGFEWSMWRGEECLKEYVGHLVKVPFLGRTFLDNSWMRALIKIAPGLREISFLGKVTSQIREHGPAMNYDSIVVDGVSSGHFVSLLQAPVGLMAMSKVGPINVQCEQIIKALNSDSVETYLTTTLETFAVQETMELYASLSKRLKSKITIVANKELVIPIISAEMIGRYEGAAKEMLTPLHVIAERQKENENRLDLSQFTNIKIPFYYQPLLEVLKDDREVQRLYSAH
jgi:anion-transporting  ArsA/GET3 family ATPase